MLLFTSASTRAACRVLLLNALVPDPVLLNRLFGICQKMCCRTNLPFAFPLQGTHAWKFSPKLCPQGAPARGPMGAWAHGPMPCLQVLGALQIEAPHLDVRALGPQRPGQAPQRRVPRHLRHVFRVHRRHRPAGEEPEHPHEACLTQGYLESQAHPSGH